MTESAISAAEAGQIAAIRQFNRFYTARLGLLQKRYLDGAFSLTEARIIYEIGATPGVTASTLRATLGLDAGYISRLLSFLTEQKLVRQTASKQDRRERLLTLSTKGQTAAAQLDRQSVLHIQQLLTNVGSAQRIALIDSLREAGSILAEAVKPTLQIVRLSEVNEDAQRILHEYYEAVHVLQRDTPQDLQRLIHDSCSGLWLAYWHGKAVGCVVLRKLLSRPLACECKRLFVQPAARGHRIADKLLDAQEEFARLQNLRWIYLDSYDDLRAAIALYRRRGYVACQRYNDNPQATVFLRKNIAPPA